MNDSPLRLRFPNSKTAFEAYDTLEELGYCPQMIESGEKSELSIYITNHDILSALEITHAHGGQLVETADHFPQRFDADPGLIHIPAHIVTEDFADTYVAGETSFD